MIRSYTDRTIEALNPHAYGAIYMPEGGAISARHAMENLGKNRENGMVIFLRAATPRGLPLT